MNSHFEIQRVWAKNISPSNAAGQTNNSNSNAAPIDPSNIHATFSTAQSNTCNESATGAGGGLGGEEVLLPVLQHVDTCTRCGKTFTLSDNNSTACTFHADDDGNPGTYKEQLLPDELTGKLTSIKAWTCCNRHHEFAAGCCARPHLCKEVMFSIRAETNPTVRIENIDLTVLKTLEVSIFPGTNYDLRIQITRALIDIIHNYFSIDNNPSTAALSSTAGQNGPLTSEMADDDFGTNGDVKKKKNFLFKLFSSKKTSKESNTHDQTLRHNSTDSGNAEMVDVYLQHRDGNSDIAYSPSSPTSPMMAGGRRQLVRHRGSASSVPDTGLNTPPNSGNHRSSTRQSTTCDSITSTQQQALTPRQKKSLRQEGLYIRYFRLGEINVDISTIGFAINLDRFKAVMETFHCRREVLDWKRLIWNIERHLAWSLTKNTASSSMSKIGDFFRFSGFSTNVSAKDTHADVLEAEMSIEEYTKQLSTKRNLLLGSPTAMKWKVRNPFSFVSSGNSNSNAASANASEEKVKRPTRIPKFLLTRQDDSSDSNDEN
jgi:hypothetical protein